MCEKVTTLSMLAREIGRAIQPHNLEDGIPIVKLYDGTDWKIYSVEDSRSYSKIKVPIVTDEHFEIFVITWKPGQSSPIHNHAEFGCILKILQGNLTEYRFTEALTPKDSRTLPTNHVGFMRNDMGVHRVQNNGDTTAVSLHIYSPPNYEAKVFLS